MTKQEAFDEINQIQDYYVDELVRHMNAPENEMLKTLSLTSATGTGKTKMMAKLINRFPDYYFIVTTLSKGQLNLQVRDNLKKDCLRDNFTVYGSQDYRINSRLEADDIIGRIPVGVRCVWLRDEGHIKTNRYEELLQDVCWKVINFSATNDVSTVSCNFTQTMMLRTVNQIGNSTPEDAIDKLLEIKKAHACVPGYNPCAIFRCVSGDKKLHANIVSLCEKHGLKYIDITDESFVMAELCEDDNEYDVIINKMKIVEGIDIRRAHVLFMDNKPNNNKTTIQVIGRCRRNALLYRDDIDILAPENRKLLEQTRECFVYYQEDMNIDQDENGELQMAFCNYVSVEKLNSDMYVSVINGQLPNGLHVIELEGETGTFFIKKDEETGFNVVDPLTHFYDYESVDYHNYVYCANSKILAKNVSCFPVLHYKGMEPFYCLTRSNELYNQKIEMPNVVKNRVTEYVEKHSYITLKNILKARCIDSIMQNSEFQFPTLQYMNDYIFRYVNQHKGVRGYKRLCRLIEKITEKQYEKQYVYDREQHKYGYYDRYVYVSERFDTYCIYLMAYCCVEYLISFDNASNLVKLCFRLCDVFKFNAPSDSAIMSRLIMTVFSKLVYPYVQFDNSDCISALIKSDIDIIYGSSIEVSVLDVDRWFEAFEKKLESKVGRYECYFLRLDDVCSSILSGLRDFENRIASGIIDIVTWHYDSLFEDLTEDERRMVRNGQIESYSALFLSQYQLIMSRSDYQIIANDKESAIIGTDTMRQIKEQDSSLPVWVEAKPVTIKISSNTKLNLYISRQYHDELDSARAQLFSGRNDFNSDLDNRCNSMIGYCVEYYSKYLVYGESYLDSYYEEAKRESGRYRARSLYDSSFTEKCVVVRACLLKYRAMMMVCFGASVGRFIKTVSFVQLVEKYEKFVTIVVMLGTKTAEYVKRTLYPNTEPCNNIDPNLSIQHITGLADYITEDTILDVKVRNNIDEKCVRQILAYHYLSTKRSDLYIRRLIIYDATSGRDAVINITDKNIN